MLPFRYSLLCCLSRNSQDSDHHVGHTSLDFGAAGLFPLLVAPNHIMEQAMDTLSDIDEALTHLNQVPVDDRGAAWRAYLDAVLDQRKELEN